MQLFAVTNVILGLIALILFKVLSSWLKKRSRAQEARRRGCRPAPLVPKKDWLGIARLRESMRATREERGPQYIAESMDEVGKDIHTVRAGVLDYELIITRDPVNVKAMLATQAEDFDIGPHRPDSFKPLLGSGIFTNRGMEWKHSRTLIRSNFGREQSADLTMFEKHVENLVRRLPVTDDRWTDKLDLSPLFFNLSLDVITEFLYGQSVYSQNAEERDQHPSSWDDSNPFLANLGHHINEAKMWIDRRGALAKYNWLLNSKDFTTHCNAVKKFADHFVEAKLTQLQNDKATDKSTDTKPTRFVLLDDLTNSTRDPIELRNETLAVLVAGRDTAACVMGWVFYFLARHPDVFTQLRTEVASRFGLGSASTITFPALWSFNYLKHVINETIRMAAVIPMNERAAKCDTTLPRGGGPDGNSPIFLPKGQQVLMPLYAMQHREDIWGPDVEEFRPDRWADRKPGWEFVPFGGGPRQCLGRKFSSHSSFFPPAVLTWGVGTEQFGRTEVMYTTVRILQLFDRIENMEAPGPIRLHHTIENRSGSGVQVRFHAAEGTSLPIKNANVVDFGLGP